MIVFPPPCAKCGQTAPSEAQFCPSCGAALGSSADGSLTRADIATEAVTLPPATGSPRRIGEGPFQAGDQVGPRYTIIRLLGVGGMGAVYQAFDHDLGVGVAIKVIQPAAQSDATTARDLEQRFKRELMLARQITHKYVVRIHDIGEIDGVKYLTMPFIDGDTLADLLRREGRLPVSRVLAMATQVAAGLAAAHDKGVVHRDLKPENIMIEQGRGGDALIMDFGIARSMVSGSTQTAAGAVIGTVAYMAPEQAQGKKVDGRTDIYSLGLIVYDCLVGRQRLTLTDNPMTELIGRFAQSPRPLREIDPAIPEAVDLIVGRALDPNPATRFQTTGELLTALQALTPDGHARIARTGLTAAAPARRSWWQFAAAGIVIVVATAGGWLASNRTRSAADAAPREPVSVLVAQFENAPVTRSSTACWNRRWASASKARASSPPIRSATRCARRRRSRRAAGSTRPPRAWWRCATAFRWCWPDRSRRPGAATTFRCARSTCRETPVSPP